MPKLNLKNMSVADLVALRDRVQQELARKISVERNALEKQIAALEELKAGAPTAQDAAKPASRRRKKSDEPKSSTRPPAKRRAAASYQGPNGEAWSGFGRAPRWLTDLEAGGKSRDAFMVTKGGDSAGVGGSSPRERQTYWPVRVSRYADPPYLTALDPCDQ